MSYKIDLFAVFIFLGIVQAIFLCTSFFSKENRKVTSNVLYGLMLISMAGCTLEIFLMYTGYIADCLFLVDFSEPLAFGIGPSFYLLVISLSRPSFSKHYYWHFAFPVLYFILLVPFFMLPEAVKYNSWVEAYNLNIPYKEYNYDGNARMFWLTDQHTTLILVSLVLYAVLTLIEGIRVFKSKKESFLKTSNVTLRNIKWILIQIVSSAILILTIKYFNPLDTGDHIFAAFVSICIYMTSFRVIGQSGFFKSASLAEQQKYKSSSLSAESHQGTLIKLKEVMTARKPYLQSDFSLPDLAAQVGVSVHVLSQVINEGLGKNFFEMAAEYRIEEAKRLLKEQPHVKIEEIAEQVGYNSKSSFNTAFKKLTGKTPSEYKGKSPSGVS